MANSAPSLSNCEQLADERCVECFPCTRERRIRLLVQTGSIFLNFISIRSAGSSEHFAVGVAVDHLGHLRVGPLPHGALVLCRVSRFGFLDGILYCEETKCPRYDLSTKFGEFDDFVNRKGRGGIS